MAKFYSNVSKLFRLNSHSSDYATSSDEEEATMLREQVLSASCNTVAAQHQQQHGTQPTKRDRVPVSSVSVPPNRRVSTAVAPTAANNAGSEDQAETGGGASGDSGGVNYPIMYSRQSSIRRSNSPQILDVQGCTLSPLLFNLYIEDAIKKVKEEYSSGVKIQGEQLDMLRFADDIAILEEREQHLERLLNGMQEIMTREYDMTINIDNVFSIEQEQEVLKNYMISGKVANVNLVYNSQEANSKPTNTRGAGSVNRGTVHRGRRRLVRKNGKSLLATVAEGWQTRRKYGQDLVNTIVNSRWRWTLFILSSCYFGCWFLFAVLYMVIAIANGDAQMDQLKSPACFGGIITFGGYLMFSIETQQTIGYGSRFIRHYCPEAVFVMCCQLICSSAICGGMLSIAYMKLANNNLPHSSSLFSKNAVICLRDGVLCLIFRVRDITGRYQVGTTINAYLVQSRSEPNEPLLKALHLEPQGVLFWPLEIVHKITPSSPFYNLSAKDLVGSKMFEFIVTLQGTSLHTGQCSKSKTSYLSAEVKWGHRFQSCVSFNKVENKYIVNHDLFHKTEEVVIPLCSAQLLSEVISEMGPNMSNHVIPTIAIDQIPDPGDDHLHHEESPQPEQDFSPLPIEVYEYVQQIKEHSKRQPIVIKTDNPIATDRTRCKDSTALDVELLISSLQNFVDHNIIDERKGTRVLNETNM